jgi:polysaccharide export outer membrane protein
MGYVSMAEPTRRSTMRPYRSFHRPFFLQSLLVLLCCGMLGACAAKRYHLDDAGLARFQTAGPVTPEFDPSKLSGAMMDPGPYRAIAGDVLRIRAPHSFFEASTGPVGGLARIQPGEHFARVDDAGWIDVPLAGRVEAAGRTLIMIEAAIVDAVSPKYLTERPAVVVTVDEYQTVPVTVLGAVQEPGIHRLRHDELTLTGALTAAGGIAQSGNLVVGARRVRVYGGAEDGGPRYVDLPIRGLNVPFYDVPLQGGERIEVERYEPDKFTVVGLVMKPGAYDYPPEVQYNLMQALAIAGGVDRLANPPYATVFRKDLITGEIVPATFSIDGNGLVESSSLTIKPGDVIAIQHTPGSWTRAFMAEIFRVNVGFYVDERSNS